MLSWLGRRRRAAALFGSTLLLLFVVGMYGYELYSVLSSLPHPISDKAIGWWDYWLFRYQTLIAGVLAIVGAAFAIYAAKLSIHYDRQKNVALESQEWERSVTALRSVIRYAQKVVVSKKNLVSHSSLFPDDYYPAILLESGPVERITLESLKDIPRNLALRCFHIGYSMQFANSMLQTNIGRKLKPPEREQLKEAFTTHVNGILFCGDILNFHLRVLGTLGKEGWKESDFDVITPSIRDDLAKPRGVSPDMANHLLKEMEITLIQDDGTEIKN